MKRRLICMTVIVLAVLMSCANRRAEVRFSLFKDPASDEFPELLLRIKDGLRSYEVKLNESEQSAGPFSTWKSGELIIVYQLLSDGAPTETMGTLELTLKSDWLWGVDFFIREDNPYDTCFGCFGWDSRDLDPKLGYDESKKLWVVWGGNSISNPVVY